MVRKLEIIDNIFSIFSNANPHPKTELNYLNNYTLLVAVVLSAQATDISVNKATKSLFAKINNPQSMVDLGEKRLKKHIKTIGLYNSKAKNIINLSKNLVKYHNGDIPNNFEDLIKLPGVGRKTAQVVLNCAFKKPTIAVDTHVFRVSNRIGFVKVKNVIDCEHALLKAIPKKWAYHAHHWLILHGRYICKARKPDCHNCNISKYCTYFQKQ